MFSVKDKKKKRDNAEVLHGFCSDSSCTLYSHLGKKYRIFLNNIDWLPLFIIFPHYLHSDTFNHNIREFRSMTRVC